VTRSDLALAALASAAVPGMRPVTVQEWRPRYESEDIPQLRQHALVEDATGRQWEVLAPRSGTLEADTEHHDPLVRELGKHLPFKVPVASGSVPLGQSGRAVVFPYVEGSALNLHRLPAGPGLASAVGRAVAAVHNVPAGLFEEFGTPVFEASEHRERRLAVLDRAAETGHVPTGLLARWEQAFDTPVLWKFTPTAVHGSLDGHAFRVVFADDDAATGRVVAMTGWAHAVVSDPAQDFAVLVDQAPAPAVDSVLESYALARSQRPDPYLLSRARLAAEMRLVDGLVAAMAGADEDSVRRYVDQLRKLDRLTSADDSLVPAEPATAGAVVQVSHDPTPLQPVAGTDDDLAEDTDDADADVEHRPDDTISTGTTAEDHAADQARRDATADLAAATVPIAVAKPTDADTQAADTRRSGSHAFGSDPSDSEPPTESPTEPATVALSVSRLGEDLDERTRLADLYDVPADEAPDLPRSG